MKKYISLDSLVAEIERLKSIQLSIFSKGETEEDCYNALSCISVYNEILSFIDTIEVKDVDLEKEAIEIVQSKEFVEGKESPILLIAKHFFELGLKAKEE